MTLSGALALIAEAKLAIPVVLFSYLNPIIAAGPQVLERARSAGASGVLVTDLPVGADPAREAWFGAGPLDFVLLVAPTTPRDRMAEIAKHGRGFVYLISRLGVTGIHAELASTLPASVAQLRSVCSLPICVGFGISTPGHARSVVSLADGIVVGSAIVQAAGRSVSEAVALTRTLRAALDDVP